FDRGANPLKLPDYSDVGDFWRDVGPAINTTNANWRGLGAYASANAGYASVQSDLNALVTQSQALFGQAVTTKTGQSFQAGFVAPLLAKYDIDLADPSTLASLTVAERSRFFLDWYDGLMSYSGADHIDYWMSTVNWRPLITQVQGMGQGTIIGLLDATVAGDPDILNNITSATGYTNALGGHGASVASLMVADHDGKGVMGIAPNASVVSYNPFDNSGTAGWNDVHTGIIALQGAGATVVNMSLGVNGWTLHGDWKTALANVDTSRTVFVLAAGNNGAGQTTDIAWDWTQNPALIVVGSVDPSGEISSFSNRPGSACLLDNGVCSTGHHLYDRFMVAPGELILVSDGAGGLERRTGTSFAAPLVSGAITLLHDRWPWLKDYPRETADIILRSAYDLGAPGPDPVYGRGLLDVEASQSPLDMSALTFFEYRNGVATEKTASAVRAAGMQTSWEADGVFFTLFETIGATKRDFTVPMSSRLVGQKSNVTGSQEYFQSYITSRLTGWIEGTNFADTATHVTAQPGQWSFAVTTALPAQPLGGQDLAAVSPHVAVKMTDPTGRFAFNAGHGEGAMVFGALPGFAQTRDYRSAEGGVNPLLGLASGGAFASVDLTLTPGTTVSFGGAERTLVHAENPGLSDYDRKVLQNVDDYRANAFNLRLTQEVGDVLTLSGSYARVREANGLLGVQSVDSGDLRHGSSSQAVTLGASLALPHGFTVSGSASSGRTRTAGDQDQSLSTVGDVRSSAYAATFAKQGLIGKRDLLQVTLTQPLHIDRGQLSYTGIEVVDRETGALGAVTRTFSIANASRQVAETLYATPVMRGRGELSLFGRAEFQSGEPIQQYMVGARLNFKY
ncbi:MAG: S8 family serine peptidase, partial [Phenylobacterium sp.]